MTIAKRIKELEQAQQDRADADVLLDFRWTGPDPRNSITFAIDGHIVDQEDGESDVDYRARSFALCKEVFRTRPELPTIKVFLPG